MNNIYTFNPADGLVNWHIEGDGCVKVTERNSIRVESFETVGTHKPAITMWFRKTLPESFHISYTFQVLNENLGDSGRNGGDN